MENRKFITKAILLLAGAATASAVFSSCTGAAPNGFHLQQQQQAFNSQLSISTKIDLLWVVDNSASMDIEQDRLRKGFSAFAQKYMQPTWDIRAAVITTDTYLASSAYSGYLNSTIGGSTGYKSPYINARGLSNWTNPAGNPTLVNTVDGKFDNGIKFKDLVPAWGPNFSKLLPGLHDGPIASICFEYMPYFMNGESQCGVRDAVGANTGVSHCLNPAGNETGVTQCVNTIENDTIHSGNAIIQTMPPAGTAGDQNWINGLIQNFMVNVTTGSAGGGSERGLQSVQQLMLDNDAPGSPTAFFRPGSLRGIIFVSDEDDQTADPPTPVPAGYTPFTHYACDQASVVAANGAQYGQPGGYCCTGGSCSYGTEGTSCASKTVDGYTYTIGLCPLASALVPVATMKSRFDTFFNTLDGGTDPNYFVVSIVALSGQTLQTLHADRQQDDINAGQLKITASDRADRYIALGNLVGNGSFAMDLGATDYSPILDAIGAAITQKEGSFALSRAPAANEQLLVQVLHANGTATTIPSTDYTVNGQTLTITDLNTILSFASTDKIVITYEPATVF